MCSSIHNESPFAALSQHYFYTEFYMNFWYKYSIAGNNIFLFEHSKSWCSHSVRIEVVFQHLRDVYIPKGVPPASLTLAAHGEIGDAMLVAIHTGITITWLKSKFQGSYSDTICCGWNSPYLLKSSALEINNYVLYNQIQFPKWG